MPTCRDAGQMNVGRGHVLTFGPARAQNRRVLLPHKGRMNRTITNRKCCHRARHLVGHIFQSPNTSSKRS